MGSGIPQMLQLPFWAETKQCMVKAQGCCWGVSGSCCLDCIAESCSYQRDAPGKPQTPSYPEGARLLSPAHGRGFCGDLSLALRMLARTGESSRKLFLHREGATAGHWPQAISRRLHCGLISSFASLGMGLGGGVQREGSASFKARLKRIFTPRERRDGGTRGIYTPLTGTDC